MKTYAGFWQRVKAFALDYLVILIYLIFIILLFLAVNSFSSLSQWLFTDRVTAQASGFVIVTLPIALYFAIGESSPKQATWGKSRLGLKVAERNRDRIRFWRAFARTILKFVPWEISHTLIWSIYFSTESNLAFINYGFALVYLLLGLNIASIVLTKTKQSLYDFLVGAVVLNEP